MEGSTTVVLSGGLRIVTIVHMLEITCYRFKKICLTDHSMSNC